MSVFSTHDHIRHVQDRSEGGLVLLSDGKQAPLRKMRFYQGQRADYFINAVWPPDILQRERRKAEYSLRPGWRLDVTLDFEKKRKVQQGKKEVEVKDLACSQEEKQALVEVLARTAYVAWAGFTPHGVHAGIYFSDWLPVGLTHGVLRRLRSDLAALGYAGPVKLDWPASVNKNRPSRFLDRFEKRVNP
nr:hypothetical protein [uncultured Methanoregula sp.]